jgi:hypothetical protein
MRAHAYPGYLDDTAGLSSVGMNTELPPQLNYDLIDIPHYIISRSYGTWAE